jgi:hypothetical protein
MPIRQDGDGRLLLGKNEVFPVSPELVFTHNYPRLPKFFITKTEYGVIKARIDDFYGLAGYLTPVKALQAGMKLSHNPPVIQILTYARIGLILFTSIDWNAKYLPSSFKSAQSMSDYLDTELIKLSTEPWDEILDRSKIEGFKDQIQHFETVLHDELAKLPAFICEDELLGNLSVDKLLKGAQNGYSSLAREVLGDGCKAEIDEAGKCLAHERSTASGFHILRSVEMAVKQYLLKVPGFVMPPLNRQNWGEYIKLLRENGAAKEVTDTLQAIKENHRNPLMHPEDTLDLPEAVTLMSLCQSMSEMLVSDMKKRALI